jgi:hypothetical protein
MGSLDDVTASSSLGKVSPEVPTKRTSFTKAGGVREVNWRMESGVKVAASVVVMKNPVVSFRVGIVNFPSFKVKTE